jgi:hypothetical protein
MAVETQTQIENKKKLIERRLKKAADNKFYEIVRIKSFVES